MNGFLFFARAALVAGFGVAAAALIGAAAPDRDDLSTGGPPQVRKLTQGQYRNSIHDIFGDDIRVEGRLPPDQASEGLIAIGTSAAGISTTGAEYYANLAVSVAGQVVSPEKRAGHIPCQPAPQLASEMVCARQVLARYAPLVLRRPVGSAEIDNYVRVAIGSAKVTGDFHSGLKYGLARLLTSPEFLFRVERAAVGAGQSRLDAASQASRLSFLLWDGPPDETLLAAAAKGDLDSAEGLRAQVDRMMASPRFERGTRAFFEDMLGFSSYSTLAKDGQIYPLASTAVLTASREQVLRTIVDQLIRENGDYRQLFVTRRTQINRPLGLLLRVPVRSEEGWEPHEWSEEDNRGGLLQQVSFLALHSHAGMSSPTLRGLAVRNIFLCQTIPPPPSNVDFTLALDVHNATLKTARDRLTAHMADPTCASCHRLMDPIGFALENYDGAGQFRQTENGAPIDPNGELNGVKFANARELGEVMSRDPMVPRCLVNRLVGYGLGRVPARGERRWVAALGQDFGRDGRFTTLIRGIALSRAFYRVDSALTQPSPAQAAPVAPKGTQS